MIPELEKAIENILHTGHEQDFKKVLRELEKYSSEPGINLFDVREQIELCICEIENS